MKKEYDELKVEIILFEEEDVIRTSGTFGFGQNPLDNSQNSGGSTPIINIP